MLEPIAWAWFFLGGVLAGIFPIMVDSHRWWNELGSEGRFIVCLLAGLVWPLFLLCAVAWAVMSLALGVHQVWRALFPAKPTLPRATAREGNEG